jgi:hypothetical protein
VFNSPFFVSSDKVLGGLISDGLGNPIPTKKPWGRPPNSIQKPKLDKVVGDSLVNLADDHDLVDQSRPGVIGESTSYSSYLQSRGWGHYLLRPKKDLPKECVLVGGMGYDALGEIGGLSIGLKSHLKQA